MNTYQVILIIWLALSAIQCVYWVDRPRKRRTMGEAVVGVAELAIAAVLVVNA